MPSAVTEAEIVATAHELGMADADGNYPREKRANLAQVAQKMRRHDEAAEQPDGDVLLSRTTHRTEAGLLTVEVRLQPHKENRT